MAARKYKIKKKKTRKMKPLLMWLFVGLFFIGTVITTIQTASLGASLANLENDADKLSEENEKIKKVLFESTSLSKISKKADQLSFVKPEAIVYIKADVPVAKLP